MKSKIRTPKILVVEDEQVTQKVLCEQVSKLGYEALCAPNGAAGLQLLLSHPEIKVVILDLVMPHLSGYEFLKVVESMYDAGVLSGTGRIIVNTQVENAAEIRNLSSLHCVLAVRRKPLATQQLKADIELCLHGGAKHLSEDELVTH